MKNIIMVLIISLIVPTFARAAIMDIQVSNNTSRAVKISWITDSDTTGEVHYSENIENFELVNPLTAYDDRGQSFIGCTHYITITDLEKENTYHFEVVSDGVVDNNSGNYYTFETMKENITLPCTIQGFVNQQDGSGAENSILYLWVRHDGVDSYPLSKLIPSNGSYFIDIKGARSVETNDIFPSIDLGDPIHIEVVYCGNCTVNNDLVFEGCTSDSVFMTLVCDNDYDGIFDDDDNCPETPNGPDGGTCADGDMGMFCMSNEECSAGGLCSMDQENIDDDENGDVCDPDDDNDGVLDDEDNCRITPNGPALGACVITMGDDMVSSYQVEGSFITCDEDADCADTGGICQMEQGDYNGSGCGDVCECEGNFEADGDVDAMDALTFRSDFGRRDCEAGSPCNGNFNCDSNVDGSDALMFKVDFGRRNCPLCEFECAY